MTSTPGTPSAGGASGSGQAHAKAILLGEHAAVYGAPAIVFPVPALTVTATASAAPGGIRIGSELYTGSLSEAPARIAPVIEAIRAAQRFTGASEGMALTIRSAIPPGRGLGSSAAVAAAVARAVAELAGRRLSADECYEIVQAAERIAHGNPSGMDARAVIADGPIRFQRGKATALPVKAGLWFVLADSGVPGSTAEAVGGVARRRAADPVGVDAMIAELAGLAEGAIYDLAAGATGLLGERMGRAQVLLARLGVSTPVLDELVAAAVAAGSPGAKLTGGGLGGCVIALADDAGQAERVGSALRHAGARRTWTATVGAE